MITKLGQTNLDNLFCTLISNTNNLTLTKGYYDFSSPYNFKPRLLDYERFS